MNTEILWTEIRELDEKKEKKIVFSTLRCCKKMKKKKKGIPEGEIFSIS